MMGNINIIYFIIPILVFIIFYATKREVKKAEKSMDLDHFTIKQSKIFLIIGLVCAVFFLGLLVWMTIFPNGTAEWWVYLVFSSFICLGLFLTIYCASWKIKIDDNQIVYCPFPGIMKQCSFTDITKMNITQQQIRAYSGNRVIFKVDWNCRGFNVLKERLQREQIPSGN